MAEEAPAAAGPSKAQAKPTKKKTAAASKGKRDALSLPKLIVQVVAESNERKGTSVAAIKKALGGKDVDVVKSNKRINTALVNLVTNGVLSQTKGIGASGSFKVAKKESEPKAKVAKKPAAKKTPTKKKAPAAKKPASKPKKTTTPKKVRSSAKKTKASLAKSPARPKSAAKKPKTPAKKTAAKKAPAKKAPAKKAAPKKAAAKKAAPKKSKK
uniref:histone H1-like n=1 Tax=Doryrhamphus excisus TaxID=161450 RepID=UPI0025AEA622|nr:histone H1-like [Doryrhamphus excisus]